MKRKKVNDVPELPGYIIPLDGTDNTEFKWIADSNRQSRRGASSKHDAKLAALNEVGDHYTANLPSHTFEGVGSLRELYKCGFFVNPNRLPKYSRFARLRDWLREILKPIVPGEPVLIKFQSLDRLLRPARFNHWKPETWEHLQQDFDDFRYFLIVEFGNRADDLVFGILHFGSQRHIRGIQSTGGQRKGKGGRPANALPYHVKDILEPEAIHLRIAFGWRAPQITNHLNAKHKRKRKIDVSTVRFWLRNNGVPAPKGCPKGTRKNRKSNNTNSMPNSNKSTCNSSVRKE